MANHMSATGKPARKHLWQVDVVRLSAFAAVIAVHSLAFTEPPASAAAGGAMMLLQFGREIFFAISGFVLVHAASGRSETTWRFWRRRIPAVLVPYACWSAIYDLTSGSAWSWSGYGLDLLDGDAKYHLYFLLVTMQLYLAFPLLLRLVRATASHAVPVLTGVAVANLAWFGALQYATAPAGLGGLWVHGYELLPTYAVYVLAGCYAAVHRERIDAAIRAHGGRLMGVAGGAGAVAVAAYVAQLGWMPPRTANAVLQPAMAATCVAAGIVLYLAGLRWADRLPSAPADPGRVARAAALGSEISFGVYLAHPLVLDVLLDHGLGNGHQVLPAAAATLLGALGAAAGAVALSLVAIRTPLSLPLTGRRWSAGRSRSITSRPGTPSDSPIRALPRRPAGVPAMSASAAAGR